jgi:hypothetical protein
VDTYRLPCYTKHETYRSIHANIQHRASTRLPTQTEGEGDTPQVVVSKVRKFLKLYPEQALAVDQLMSQLAARVKRFKKNETAKSTWESEHPNGRAAEFNEDGEEVE